jgi:hypothetical protein
LKGGGDIKYDLSRRALWWTVCEPVEVTFLEGKPLWFPVASFLRKKDAEEWRKKFVDRKKLKTFAVSYVFGVDHRILLNED